MTALRLVPTRTNHIASLLADVREIDAEEWRIASGGQPLEACVVQCVMLAEGRARSILDEAGRCLCIYGASRMPGAPRRGVAWLIGTNEGQRRALHIQRYWKQGIAELHREFDVLEAHAYDANTVHHFWMERLGFVRCGASRAFGVPGFTKFERFKNPSVL